MKSYSFIHNSESRNLFKWGTESRFVGKWKQWELVVIVQIKLQLLHYEAGS